MSERKRGAPFGNRNALKHGYYSRQNPPTTTELFSLTAEIELLRHFIHHILDLGQDTTTLPEAESLLRSLSLASATLARLVRTQHIISPPKSRDDELSSALEEALQEVCKEMGI